MQGIESETFLCNVCTVFLMAPSQLPCITVQISPIGSQRCQAQGVFMMASQRWVWEASSLWGPSFQLSCINSMKSTGNEWKLINGTLGWSRKNRTLVFLHFLSKECHLKWRFSFQVASIILWASWVHYWAHNLSCWTPRQYLMPSPFLKSRQQPQAVPWKPQDIRYAWPANRTVQHCFCTAPLHCSRSWPGEHLGGLRFGSCSNLPVTACVLSTIVGSLAHCQNNSTKMCNIPHDTILSKLK